MKIKLLPFDVAREKSNRCYKKHRNKKGECLGIMKYAWRNNAVVEVFDITHNGYYLGDDGFYYCDCCCEVIEE